MAIDSGIGDDEREAVEELRNRMKGDLDQELFDDTYFLLRFLKARDFEIKKAEEMLRKHIIWREKYDVKNVLNYKKTEVMEKYFIYILLGYDKEGCPIRYAPFGPMDMLGLVASWAPDEFTRHMLYESEIDTLNLKKQSEKLGKNVDKCVYICNYENFSFGTATNKKVLYNTLYYVDLYINNYPERLKEAYIINAPIYFHIFFSMLKTILPKTILDKIHIYSNDSYKEDLLKIIDADVLPSFLGGSRTDPDGNPLCVTIIPPAERVPESYYIRTGRSLVKAPDVKIITLDRAAFHEEILEVEEVGSYLEWEFETKCRDIGFGLFYNEVIGDEEKITELVPLQRIDTAEYPETGTFRCERPGKYVIVFDNTYSKLRTKEIYCRTKVVTPKEHEAELHN